MKLNELHWNVNSEAQLTELDENSAFVWSHRAGEHHFLASTFLRDYCEKLNWFVYPVYFNLTKLKKFFLLLRSSSSVIKFSFTSMLTVRRKIRRKKFPLLLRHNRDEEDSKYFVFLPAKSLIFEIKFSVPGASRSGYYSSVCNILYCLSKLSSALCSSRCFCCFDSWYDAKRFLTGNEKLCETSEPSVEYLIIMSISK